MRGRSALLKFPQVSLILIMEASRVHGKKKGFLKKIGTSEKTSNKAAPVTTYTCHYFSG